MVLEILLPDAMRLGPQWLLPLRDSVGRCWGMSLEAGLDSPPWRFRRS